MKVKVGPITASYRGAAQFVEQDQATHRAVLRADGRDTRGRGNANATITASLSPAPTGTRVEVANFERTVLGKAPDEADAPPPPAAAPATSASEGGPAVRAASTSRLPSRST